MAFWRRQFYYWVRSIYIVGLLDIRFLRDTGLFKLDFIDFTLFKSIIYSLFFQWKN